MKRFQYSDIVLVGFDGSVVAECGTARAIARHRTQDICFKLCSYSGVAAAHSVYSKKELVQYSERQLVTMLDESKYQPVPAFPHVIALFVTQSFLAALRAESPPAPAGLLPDWQLLPPHDLPEAAWVTFLTEAHAQILLDHCAARLLADCTDRLRQFFLTSHQEDRDRAEGLADSGLAAARSRNLRASLFGRYGLAIRYSPTPERLRNLYDLTVQLEFPELSSFDAFSDTLNDIERELRSDPRHAPVKGPTDESGPLKRMLSRVREVNLLADVEDRRKRAAAISTAFFSEFHVRYRDNQAQHLARQIETAGDSLQLDDARAVFLASEPAVYSAPNAIWNNGTVQLRVVRFLRELRITSQAKMKPGPVGMELLKQQ